jgi:hypothetical protein
MNTNSSVFVGGWRPFIGWVCGLALLWQFFIAPIGSALLGWQLDAVRLDTGEMLALVGAQLGVSIPRTVEKLKGVAAKAIGHKVETPEEPTDFKTTNEQLNEQFSESEEEGSPWTK